MNVIYLEMLRAPSNKYDKCRVFYLIDPVKQVDM